MSSKEAQAPVANGWSKPTVFALVGVAVSMLLLLASIGELIPPLVIFSIVAGIIAWLCVKFGSTKRWPWFVAALGCLLLVLGNLPFLVEDLAHPETAFVFVPTVVAVLFAIVGFVGGLSVGLNRQPPVRPIIGSAAAVFGIAFIVSIVAFIALESDSLQAGDIVVEVRGDFPEELTASAGEISFFIDNTDRGRHTFVIDELDVHTELPGLTKRRAVFEAAAGEYVFYCDVPGHEFMEGVLTVE